MSTAPPSSVAKPMAAVVDAHHLRVRVLTTTFLLAVNGSERTIPTPPVTLA
jgi:hypothetical protein